MNFIWPLLIFSSLCFAKDQSGDPFRTSYESSFPRSENTHHKNSLHVVARPLAEEPFFSLAKAAVDLAFDDFRTLLRRDSADSSVTSLARMDELFLRSATVLSDVWSYHAFPVHLGGLSRRFGTPPDMSWHELRALRAAAPAEQLIAEGRSAELSPLEKYEWLTGIDFTLSEKEWLEGAAYLERLREIPSWIGICHGTAPASLVHPRPRHSVRMTTPDHQGLVFSPSDLKALLSFSWAKSGGASAILGRRCGDVLIPGVRPSGSCRDTNPAAMHLALVNRLGLERRPLIMDASAGREVWNRVIVGYRYQYFRPGPRNLTSELARALVDVAQWRSDPLRDHRSPRAQKIVGIEMELTYVIGTEPSGRASDEKESDRHETMWLRYDLELDARGDVIGGEWLEHGHPDFLWVVAADVRPRTLQDMLIGGRLQAHPPQQPLKGHVLEAAQAAAANGEILHSLIERMLQLSQ